MGGDNTHSGAPQPVQPSLAFLKLNKTASKQSKSTYNVVSETMAFKSQISDVVNQLYDIGGLKFGDFVIKSGRRSPIYVDLRVIISHPKLMNEISKLMWDFASSNIQKCDSLCGVPYTALPIATLISARQEIPMLIRRKEAKGYGTKKLIEGDINAGESCVIIEDVVTTGSSVLETVADLRKEGLVVTDAIVIVDREQGGPKNLEKEGINCHSVCTLMQMMDILKASGKVDDLMLEKVQAYLQDNNDSTPVYPVNKRTISFETRAEKAPCEVSKNLLQLMARKRSNLCVAADVGSASDLLEIAKQVGPYICVLKTHADVTANFTQDVADDLILLAQQMDFMILEDRKFADIGNTVAKQYSGGYFDISRWADLVTVHSLPGEGVLQAIQGESEKLGAPRGCFLLAEMSSEGNLITMEYIKGTTQMATKYPKIVAGLVCQSLLLADQVGLVQLTPGVRRGEVKEDGLGQQWVTPEEAVIDKGGDVIVVGRGVTAAKNPAVEAKLYRDDLWAAYEKRILA
ncbi:uridine 5'-monophosphate synthase isoform X2 [Neocloeon triangulifer]|uniref:uridine 5'-monophosphate synthase isoform X2 n=1 Tax=Neocloeon triangulifer TaxID=2078957 RepID=UPI00286F87E5|nr:uridine 5'-monophosphate synthase isoform X2 [Neocloeon triangulifer]